MPCHNLVTTIEEVLKYAKGKTQKGGPKSIATRHWRIHAEIVERPEAIKQKPKPSTPPIKHP